MSEMTEIQRCIDITKAEGYSVVNAQAELTALHAEAEKWRTHEAENPKGCQPKSPGYHDVEDLDDLRRRWTHKG